MKDRALTLRSNRDVLPESSLSGVRDKRKTIEKRKLGKRFITLCSPSYLKGDI